MANAAVGRKALAALARPEIVMVSGVPEIFCDVAIAQLVGETARIILARQIEQLGPYEQTGLLIMPLGGFRHSRYLNRDTLSDPVH